MRFKIEGDNIIRELGFELMFDSEITYDMFIENEEYSEIFKNHENLHLRRGFNGKREIKGLEDYDLICENFFTYSYIETFEGMLLYNDFLRDACKIIPLLHQGANLSDEETSMLNFYVTNIKYYITKNKFFYKTNQGLIFQQAKLVTPFRDDAIKTNLCEELKTKRQKIKNVVSLKQEQINNKIHDYLFFLTIVSDIQLFLLINITENRYIITDKKHIHQYCMGPGCLTINLTDFYMGKLAYSSQEMIATIKSKVKTNNVSCNTSQQVFDDIAEIIKNNPSCKIEINSSRGEVNHMEFLIRDQNLNNYEQVKSYKRGESRVTRSTTIEEHGTKKTAIVSHGKIKYKK